MYSKAKNVKEYLDEAKLLHVTYRAKWRDWLKKHYKSEREVWLVFYKKHTGKPRILYNDAVEEALCFGWIDSTVRRIDEDRYAQRFSVRNPKTPYSQSNKERLKKLIKQSKVSKEVLVTLGDLEEEPFVIRPDILKAIKENTKAWKNFQAFSQSYIRIRIAFIDGARKRPQEFKKRLRYFIEMTEKNKQFGFGGIEKYY
ncbi:YdeI family protein [Acidobacteriota bacterium]